MRPNHGMQLTALRAAVDDADGGTKIINRVNGVGSCFLIIVEFFSGKSA